MGTSDTIKHFEALQKRYTRQHNGTACEHVKLALEGLGRVAEKPTCAGCIHQGDQFNNFCPDCDRRREYRPDRYEPKEGEHG